MSLNENIDDFATGEYTVTRAARGRLVNGHYVKPSAWQANHPYSLKDRAIVHGMTFECVTAGTSVGAAAPAWQASHAYALNDIVKNSGFQFKCTTAGLSDIAGGPSTRASGIVDGVARWSYIGDDGGPSLQIADVTDGTVHWKFLQLNSFTVVSSVQPISGKDLQDLEEGQRADEMRKMFVYTELFTRTAETDPDLVVIEGSTYRVETVEGPWTMDDETHWNVTVAKVSRP